VLGSDVTTRASAAAAASTSTATASRPDTGMRRPTPHDAPAPQTRSE
jgi:hypothetical protein